MESKEIFERINIKHKESVIVSLSGKLRKRCKLTTGEDARNLCRLAYWLYVFGDTEEVEALYGLTTDVPFPGRAWFDVWTYLLYLWGLEIHILRERGENQKAEEIVALMDQYLHSSPATKEQEMARRRRFTYEFVCNGEKIAAADSVDSANSYRLSSLYSMLGRRYSGLYPNLLEARVEAKAEEYIKALKESYNAAEEYEKTAEQMYRSLKKATQTPVVYFTPEEKKAGLFDSKIGGAYYVPAGEMPPADELTGTPLFLLAQINFGQMKAPSPFPEQGLLQIFITGDDDLYGLDFNDQMSQKRWKIRYYEEIPETAGREASVQGTSDFESSASEQVFVPVITEQTMLPFSREYRLKARKGKQVMTAADYRFDACFRNACEPYLRVNQSSVFDLDNDLYNRLMDKLQTFPAQIGGYPVFTQSDPRETMEADIPNILLFQLDTVEDIMWGDSGVGNFFIREEDLKNRDFTRVLYNWDCC